MDEDQGLGPGSEGAPAPSSISSGSMAALNDAENNFNQAQQQFDDAKNGYDSVMARAAAQQATAQEVQAASAQLDNARNQLDRASTSRSAVYRQAAQLEAQAAKTAGSPELAKERSDRAAYYEAQATTVASRVQAQLARAASYETPEQRLAREQTIETQRTQAASDLETQRSQSASNLESQRQQGASGLESQRAGAQLQDTALQGQNRLSEIAATRDAALQEAQQKFAQDQDLESLRSALARANQEALANTQAELQRQTQLQQFQLEKPYKDVAAQTEQQNAATNAQRATQEGQYQQGELGLRQQQLGLDAYTRQQQTEMGYRTKMGDSLQAMSKVGLDLGNEGVKYGAAPVEGLGKTIADPLSMAYQVFQEGLQNGMWSADRMPSFFGQAQGDQSGAPPPTNASPPVDQGAPVPTGATG